MPIKAVSLDFWNTLFTESPGAFKLYQETRQRLLSELLCEYGDFTDEHIQQACLTEGELHYKIWREEHRTLAAAERVGNILSHLEVCLPDGLVAKLARTYEEGILERPPVLIPGVREGLARLAGRYRLGIISDVGFSPGRVLKQVLRQEGLLDAFASLVFSDEAGYSKPHRQVFEQTARALAARPHEMAHVGDLEFTDIIGAKNAGYHAIRFTGVTPLGDDEETIADRVTAEFAEMPTIIETLAS